MADQETWAQRHSRSIDAAAAVLLTGGALYLLAHFLLGPRNLDFSYMQGITPRLLDASKVTFTATSIAFLVGMAIGFFVGWAKTARPAPPVVGERPFGVMVLAVVFVGLAFIEVLSAVSLLGGPGYATAAPIVIAALYLVGSGGLWKLQKWGWILGVVVNALFAAASVVFRGFENLSAVTALADTIAPALLILYLFMVAGAFGIEIPLLARGSNRFVRRVAEGYVELMRGTPLFVQIVFVWTVLLFRNPGFQDQQTLAFVAGTLAMTINTGAYQGEIFRGGFQTVHSAQVEAARAVGLSRWQTMRFVALPQALRLVVPPLTNEYVGLLKASSLLFFIGVAELTFEAKQLSNREVRIFEVFVVVTAIYLLITVPLSNAVQALERRFRIPGLGIQAQRPERIRWSIP